MYFTLSVVYDPFSFLMIFDVSAASHPCPLVLVVAVSAFVCKPHTLIAIVSLVNVVKDACGKLQIGQGRRGPS